MRIKHDSKWSISFESKKHRDGDVFDGPGGTLVFAYSPKEGGDVHFDDSETWTINSYDGIAYGYTIIIS